MAAHYDHDEDLQVASGMEQMSQMMNLNEEADVAGERGRENARRMSRMLADYYGTPGVGAAEEGEGTPPRVRPGGIQEEEQNDIDSPRKFSAEKHVRSMVEGMGYTALVQEHESLRDECRKLDGDMKTLVSSNYTKVRHAARRGAARQRPSRPRPRNVQLRSLTTRTSPLPRPAPPIRLPSSSTAAA